MKKPRFRSYPEKKIQEDFTDFLKERGWRVERMHGNVYQKGIPDLYIAHKKFGQRWVDIKNPVSYEFTKDQRIKWPLWEQYGVGIWIIIAADETEYDKLFKPPNWRKYWKSKYDEEPTQDELIQELKRDDNDEASKES